MGSAADDKLLPAAVHYVLLRRGAAFLCAGRRTFICFALSSGIPPQVVMKWTGHSDYQAMKPYIAIAEKTKADAKKLFDEELKK